MSLRVETQANQRLHQMFRAAEPDTLEGGENYESASPIIRSHCHRSIRVRDFEGSLPRRRLERPQHQLRRSRSELWQLPRKGR